MKCLYILLLTYYILFNNIKYDCFALWNVFFLLCWEILKKSLDPILNMFLDELYKPEFNSMFPFLRAWAEGYAFVAQRHNIASAPPVRSTQSSTRGHTVR